MLLPSLAPVSFLQLLEPLSFSSTQPQLPISS
jgi:hypothetical protein